MSRKLGIEEFEEGDHELIADLLSKMEGEGLDYTLSFLALNPTLPFEHESIDHCRSKLSDWIERWKSRLGGVVDGKVVEVMQSSNPLVIPRNHLIAAAIDAAERGDFSVFHRLREQLKTPYQWSEGHLQLVSPAKPHEVVEKTFCGT